MDWVVYGLLIFVILYVLWLAFLITVAEVVENSYGQKKINYDKSSNTQSVNNKSMKHNPNGKTNMLKFK